MGPIRMTSALVDHLKGKKGQRGTPAGVVAPAVARVHGRLACGRDPHGSVKQIHRQELKDGNKEGPADFPKSC